MSAPVGHYATVDDVTLYAPPWARERVQAAAAPAAGPDDAPSLSPPAAEHRQHRPRMPMGIGGPNLELPLRLRTASPFTGDVAMTELRRRLSLDPEIVPEPPVWAGHDPRGRAVLRWSFALMSGVIAAFGVVLLDPQGSDGGRSKDAAAMRAAPAPAAAPAAPPSRTGPAIVAPASPARLVVERRRAFANEPLPLGLALSGASGGEFVLLKGLAAGTSLSAGIPEGARNWRVPARDIASVFAYAPKDYVGTMDAAIDLRAGDRLVDSQTIRLEWIEKALARSAAAKFVPGQSVLSASPPLRLEPQELAILLERGQELLRNGDIAAARLVLRRAAKAGSAEAALSLGNSFDPTVLRDIGVLGFAADPVQAQSWYRKAGELGSTEALRRLQVLTRAAGG
jgi:hypothetical protein